MSEFWYYAEGDEARGPITFDQLLQFLSQLPTPRGVAVWRDGFDDWKAAENVREIAEKLVRPPPLIPKDSVAKDDTVARYQKQFQNSESKATPQSGPIGLGGWLAYLGFGLCVAPVRTFFNLIKEWQSVDANLFQQYPLSVRGLLAIEIAFLLLWVCAATLFFMHSRKFPRFLIWLLVATVFEQLVGVAWLKLTLPNIDITNALGPEQFAHMTVAAIAALLWIPYLLRSKRVANTFVDAHAAQKGRA